LTCDCYRIDNKRKDELESARENYDKFLEFVQSIPNYIEIQHLSNEQFKRKLDYLKRKQRILLNNLRNCLEQEDKEDEIAKRASVESRNGDRNRDRPKSTCEKLPDSPRILPDSSLELKGKRCNLEESRTNTPLSYTYGSFSYLAEDQDCLTYR
jgi:hypothetical protein